MHFDDRFGQLLGDVADSDPPLSVPFLIHVILSVVSVCSVVNPL